MSPVLPALLASAAVAVLLGLPLPRRVLVTRGRGLPHRLRATALPAVAGVTALLLWGSVAGVLAAWGTFAVQRAQERRRDQVARKHERAAATEAMTALAAELRAGRVPSDAYAAAAEVAKGPTSVALQAASAAVRWGAGPEDALQRHAPSTAVPEMMLALAACWQVCSGTGSSLATAVDRLEDALRQEARQRDLVDSETAQARASALVMASLPAIGVLLGSGMGGRPFHVLFHTPVGLTCLVLGVCLDLLGLWWMRRLIARAVGRRA